MSIKQGEVLGMRFKILALSFFVVLQLPALGQNAQDKEARETARQELAKKGVKFDEESFIKAIMEDDPTRVSQFLAAGMNPNAQDKDGTTALIQAISEGHKKIALALIANGADVNQKVESNAPLRVAAACGDVEIAEALLAKGAEVDSKDKGGHTPMLIAMFGTGYRSVPEAFVDQFISGKTPSACMDKTDGYDRTVRLLIDRGADVNIRASDGGETPLFVASLFGNIEMVQLLLAKRVNVNSKAWQDRSVMSWLRSLGTLQNDPEIRDDKVMMDWLRSTLRRHQEIIRLLRQAGAR